MADVLSLLLLLLFAFFLSPTSAASCVDDYLHCRDEALKNATPPIMMPGKDKVTLFCRRIRDVVAPCMMERAGVAVPTTAYERGLVLSNCSRDSAGGKQESERKQLRAEASHYFSACIYNDINTVQCGECFNYLGSSCDGNLTSCHLLYECPPGSGGGGTCPSGRPSSTLASHKDFGLMPEFKSSSTGDISPSGSKNSEGAEASKENASSGKLVSLSLLLLSCIIALHP